MAPIVERHELVVASPLLLHGAAGSRGNTAEVRAPSLRGVLRYWLRAALRGAGYDEAGLRSVEQRLFGAAAEGGGARASAVRVQLLPLSRPQFREFKLLPHLLDEHEQPLARDRRDISRPRTSSHGFACGMRADLMVGWRPGTREGDREIFSALSAVAFALGGLGQRSRRGFGTVSREPSVEAGAAVDRLRGLLERGRGGSAAKAPRNVSCLSPERCVIVERELRKTGRGDPAGVFRETLREVMTSFHEAARGGGGGPTFGKVAGARYASAIHVRIFATADPPVLRATVFKVEDNANIVKLLTGWRKALRLEAVWGKPWF